jgi:uncharacterized protein YndB with AHSA1/START domain
MPTFTVTREIAAPPGVVFETVADHRRYPDFTPIRRAELEREGDDAPLGPGAIRALHTVGPPVREQVIANEAPRLFAYRLLSGLPVRDHTGTVVFEPAGVGTRISYTVETTPRIPLSGPLVAAGGRLAVRRLLAAVGGEAERRARESAAPAAGA